MKNTTEGLPPGGPWDRAGCGSACVRSTWGVLARMQGFTSSECAYSRRFLFRSGCIAQYMPTQGGLLEETEGDPLGVGMRGGVGVGVGWGRRSGRLFSYTFIQILTISINYRYRLTYHILFYFPLYLFVICAFTRSARSMYIVRACVYIEGIPSGCGRAVFLGRFLYWVGSVGVGWSGVLELNDNLILFCPKVLQSI